MRLISSLLALCLASCALYLGISFVLTHALTFPLDDAWIHLTFARNLALRHEFAFNVGQPSAGSTSPLWTFALAPSFLLPIAPEWWSYTLGATLLFACAWLTYRISRQLFGDTRVASVSALAVALEWHLNWAAYSGMETMLFVALLLLMFDLYIEHKPLWLVGFIAGLCVVTRPEGVILFALIVAHVFFAPFTSSQAGGMLTANRAAFGVLRFVPMLLAFALPLLPYLWFNWTTSGSLFPNTFYAKQGEYAELFAQQSLLAHWLHLLTVTLVGAQVLLVPGFIFALYLAVHERRALALILFAWWLMLPLAYALRLPVDYQHARYEMPVIPTVMILGIWGTAPLRERLPAGAVTRVLTRAWLLTFPMLLVIFWFIGATARADDAAAIYCLEVETAQWLDANTLHDDVIAAHDVGAIGYYLKERPLIDLAGLITPDVIYFLRDEPRLLQYALAHHARFVVTSAAWHPNLIRDSHLQLVEQHDCSRAHAAGGYQIGVYQVRQP